MDETLKVINKMQAEGLFKRYAIGGGIGALFYIEPIATFDLDIFVILSDESSTLVSLSPLYYWLAQKGYNTQGGHVIIEGIPVQFIPVYNDLIEEAVRNSVVKVYENTRTYVLQPEYLIAILVQTSRPKDRERLIKFLDESELCFEKLDAILLKYDLKKAYDNFRRQYYDREC